MVMNSMLVDSVLFSFGKAVIVFGSHGEGIGGAPWSGELGAAVLMAATWLSGHEESVQFSSYMKFL